MRLESIDLKGVLRFRDRLTLDLSNLAGLVAIVGANGEGKSTILETPPAATFRQFPSRADRELVDYAHDRDSYLQHIFRMGDRRFRARVALDAVGRKSEAVLLAIDPDGTERPLNDGKVSTFDQAVREHLPAQNVILASAFAAQNRRGSFVTLDRKGRKQLFAELLGLEHYEQMAETARRCASILGDARLTLIGRRDTLAAACSQPVEQDLIRRAGVIESDRATWLETRDQLDVRIGLLVTDEESARAAEQAHHAALQRQRDALTALRTLEQQVTAIESQESAASELQQHELAQIAKDRTRVKADLEAALDKIERDAAAERKDKLDRIANNERVLGDAPAIRQAVADVTRLEHEIAETTQAAASNRATLREQQQAREVLLRQIQPLDQADGDLTRARRAAAIVNSVPCGGAQNFAGCQFLTDAKTAAESIPGLERTILPLADLRASVAELDTTIAAQHEEESRLSQDLARRQRALATARDLARKAEPLANAEGQIAAHRAALAQIPARVSTDRAAATDAAAERWKELDARTSQADERAWAEIERCQAEGRRLAALKPTHEQDVKDAEAAVRDVAPVAGRLAGVQADLTAARSEHAHVTAQLARVEERMLAIERERAALDQRRYELVDLDATIRRIDTELLDWQTLAKVLGRDGLPVLEIDAAGPTVSGICNQLMQACFSGRFSLDLVTQEAKTSGKGLKDSFELKVLDNERGGTARDVSDLSGGEQVIISECLASAIAVYVNTRSQTPMRTCWRDETTGALDPENADRYIAMLRKLRELAGFELILFVSHNADAAAQADAQIWVHDGTADVLYPPFGQRQEAA